MSLFSSRDYPHSLLAFIRSRAQVSPPYPPLRSFRRYERCQILSIYCVANIGPTSFSRTCKSVFLFCKLGDGATLPLNPFLRTSPLVSPFYLFRFSSLFPPPPSSSPRSPTRSLARSLAFLEDTRLTPFLYALFRTYTLERFVTG